MSCHRIIIIIILLLPGPARGISTANLYWKAKPRVIAQSMSIATSGSRCAPSLQIRCARLIMSRVHTVNLADSAWTSIAGQAGFKVSNSE